MINQKTKKYRPTQIKIGENNKQKITPKNKKFRSVSTQLHKEPMGIRIHIYGLVESRNGKEIMLQ